MNEKQTEELLRKMEGVILDVLKEYSSFSDA